MKTYLQALSYLLVLEIMGEMVDFEKQMMKMMRWKLCQESPPLFVVSEVSVDVFLVCVELLEREFRKVVSSYKTHFPESSRHLDTFEFDTLYTDDYFGI